jgi:hypothetical protein
VSGGAGFGSDGRGHEEVAGVGRILPLAVLAFNAPAGALNKKQFYDGVSEQGQELFFIMENIGGVWNFEPFFTNFTITCNNEQFTWGWFFIGFQIPLVNQQFDINLPGDQIPFDWTGTVKVGKLKSFGTQSQGYSAYSQNGAVVDCGTGPVNWTATGVAPRAPTHRHTDWTVTVVKDVNGHISETITHG